VRIIVATSKCRLCKIAANSRAEFGVNSNVARAFKFSNSLEERVQSVSLERRRRTEVVRVCRKRVGEARSLVKPFPAELMDAHEISKRINNPKYDAPDCSAPVED
jgi:hypothetical protein